MPVTESNKMSRVIKKFADAMMIETEDAKIVRSRTYNYNFNKKTGFFVRWGETVEADPSIAPFPEILDIEVSEICNGVPNPSGVESPCSFCYKANTRVGRNMSFDTFKTIIDKMPFLTQVAFGADAKAESNPDLFRMLEYSRSIGIIPNLTVANISDETADFLSSTCGAVAVSRYANKDICYNSVKKLTDRGMKQVNIHQMVSTETFDQVFETLRDMQTDERLRGVNAVVMLSLKKVGRGVSFSKLPDDKFKEIVDYALDNRIGLGFDSCSQHKFEKAVRGRPNYKELIQLSDPCESTAFSVYINVEGNMYSCSFCEKAPSFPVGVSVVESEDFIRDVWNHEKTAAWRQNMLDKRSCGSFGCPVYDV